MASSSLNNNPSENIDGFAIPDTILLCDAWKQVTYDGKWYDQDNQRTWEEMAGIFNPASKKDNSLWKDRVVLPDQLVELRAKVLPAVIKFNRFYNEKERPTPHPKFVTESPASRGHYRKILLRVPSSPFSLTSAVNLHNFCSAVPSIFTIFAQIRPPLEALDIALAELAPTHVITLGLALNFSVFYYEIPTHLVMLATLDNTLNHQILANPQNPPSLAPGSIYAFYAEFMQKMHSSDASTALVSDSSMAPLTLVSLLVSNTSQSPPPIAEVFSQFSSSNEFMQKMHSSDAPTALVGDSSMAPLTHVSLSISNTSQSPPPVAEVFS
ncbi:hypothetical protein LguiA_005585 [Lonicera macranthoides]